MIRYLKGINLLGTLMAIAFIGPVFASGQGTTPPLTEEDKVTTAPPSQPTVKQKKSTEEKAKREAEKVAETAGEVTAKVDNTAHTAKKKFNEAYRKEKNKLKKKK